MVEAALVVIHPFKFRTSDFIRARNVKAFLNAFRKRRLQLFERQFIPRIVRAWNNLLLWAGRIKKSSETKIILCNNARCYLSDSKEPASADEPRGISAR